MPRTNPILALIDQRILQKKTVLHTAESDLTRVVKTLEAEIDSLVGLRLDVQKAVGKRRKAALPKENPENP